LSALFLILTGRSGVTVGEHLDNLLVRLIITMGGDLPSVLSNRAS
jgi:hypothetical protein